MIKTPGPRLIILSHLDRYAMGPIFTRYNVFFGYFSVLTKV